MHNNSHLFIEKPLIANVHEIKKISNILSKKKSISMIGYQMRFHPVIDFLKKVYKKLYIFDFSTIRYRMVNFKHWHAFFMTGIVE